MVLLNKLRVSYRNSITRFKIYNLRIILRYKLNISIKILLITKFHSSNIIISIRNLRFNNTNSGGFSYFSTISIHRVN